MSAGPVVEVLLIDLDGVDRAALTAGCRAEERDRAARFRDPAVGDRWLAGRGALRAVLGAATGRAGAAVEFRLTASGKPGLVLDDGVHFNLAHTAAVVAVALAESPVGVDIEPADRRLTAAGGLADRLLGPATAARTAWEHSGRPATVLLRAWTRAEALLKATGEGVAGGLGGVEERLVGRGWAVADLHLPAGVGPDRRPGGDGGRPGGTTARAGSLVGAVALAGESVDVAGARWIDPLAPRAGRWAAGRAPGADGRSGAAVPAARPVP